MYWSAILFVCGCAVYAAYSLTSIRHLTHTALWHLLQWLSCGMFIAAGFAFGLWWQDGFTWRGFGDIMAVAVLGVTAYIVVLRCLQRRF